MTIVGVVGTVKQYGLDVDGRIVVYRPSAGLLRLPGGADVVRSGGGRRARSCAQIHEVDPDHPVFDVQTMHGPDAGIRWRASASPR